MMPHSPGVSDALVVINGPEDGTEFPLVRSTASVGDDALCDICLRLDNAIEPKHATVSVVSEGYRVRRTGQSPVFVDGKKAGALRSRIVRNGGTVQIGNTLMALECVPDGLANRSRGVAAESDFVWAVRHSASGLAGFAQGFFGFFGRFVGKITSSWLLVVGIIIVSLAVFPTFREYFLYYVQVILQWAFQAVGYLRQ